jgi:pyruvate, orthophosphate dikinase
VTGKDSDTGTQWVVAFDEPLPGGADASALLGGKGANLAEMARELGLPVPPGFTITTRACLHYLDRGWPDGLNEEVLEHLDRVGKQLGRRFGDPSAPLLVSVRSGAPVSMPGMMDTLLNVGMTPEIRDRLAEETGDELFAANTWLRFCSMYTEIVLGVPKPRVDEATGDESTAAGMLDASARIRQLAETAGGIPEDPRKQLRGAIEAVFRSWNSERARVFRAREGIDEAMGTAVTVQAMVFGNLDDRSGTGVAFTRDPATGDPQPFGDYLARAQGEDVVAGTHAVRGLVSLQEQLPETYDELLATLDRLERHYRDMCDVEFTVSSGKLYMLQTRIGRRSPLAAVRIAVSMASDPGFPLSKAEAVARVDQTILHQLTSLGRVDPEAEPVGTGLAASPGVGAGVLCCDPNRAAELAEAGTAVILARDETSPADVHGMVAAAGLVTTLGGVASHAAVVARSWAIPAITSLEHAEVRQGGLAIGTTFIAEGDTVTVDGSTGALYLGDRREEGAAEFDEVRMLREWAAELGVEPGTPVEHEAEAPERADVSLMEVLRTLQLKGLCNAERLAAALSTSMATVEEALAGEPSFVRETPRGAMLTPEGRAWVLEQLAAERKAINNHAMEGCYGRFLPFNERFKRIVSEWQVASAPGHTDEQWQAVVDAVAGLHDDYMPLVDDAANVAPRLASYAQRFAHALEAMRGGDTSMLASPLKDSYHTVWFEFHEELIELCGRDRATEERSGH